MVGDHERHAVEFQFNKFWGNLSIKVDDHVVVRDIRFMSFKLKKIYEFPVGEQELHVVRIEKTRALAFAGFRAQPVRGFVDDNLVAEGVA